MAHYTIEDYISNLHAHNSWFKGSGQGALDAPTPRTVQGVNVFGYLRDESGLGTSARAYIRALKALEIPVALKDLSGLSSNRSQDETFARFDDELPYDVNLVCVDVGQHFSTLAQNGVRFFEDRYNIGLWWWELPRFPTKWYDRFGYYDEIWSGTSFITDTLSPISPVPVVKIPHILTPPTYGSREAGRRHIGATEEEFVFLFIFDFHSHFRRKNPLAVLEAFRKAFKPTDPVRLVFKTVNADSDPEAYAALKAHAGNYPVTLCDGYWTAQEVMDLKAGCDAFVSLHRSEGVGLNLSDAMAHGKPVIATGWSGNMEFMSVSNSFPVRYELKANDLTVGPYSAGETWAEPDVEHAAEILRYVFENREHANSVGERARRDLETQFSEGAVAEVLQRRLKVIEGRHQFTAFRQEIQDFFHGYQDLAGRIRQVVGRVTPTDEPVIVVSKGDNDLLQLGGRAAWHFPQTEDGTYAGSHPADSAYAIEHLEGLRGRGGRYLLFPGTAFWWLDYYEAFKSHLDDRYTRLWGDESCILFDLAGTGEL